MSNPTHPLVYLKIGDVDVTSAPNNLISFEQSRTTANAAKSISFSLYDRSSVLLEYEILKGSGEIEFKYGYEGGLLSKLYKAKIANSSLDFNGEGVTLSIEAFSDGAFTQAEPSTSDYTGDIHEIVQQIAEENKWKIGHIEPCQPVYDGDSKKQFSSQNLPPVAFIRQQLIPYAKSQKNGQSGYQLYFKDTEDGSSVYFEPLDYSKSPSRSYEYIIGQEHDNILSFQPELDGIIAAMIGGGKVEADTVNTYTNDMFSVFKDRDTEGGATSGSKAPDTSSFKRVIGTSSYSNTDLDHIASYMWASCANYAYPATLELRGDPTIEPMMAISVVVLTPDGLPHHTSGLYLVTEVSDSIDEGSYTTTLSLVRNALTVGKTDGGGIDISLSSSPLTAHGQLGGTNGSTGDGSSNSQNGTQTPGGVPPSKLTEVINKYIGIPYVWGGKNPQTGLDCSGFTKVVMKDLGVTIGDGTYGQQNDGTEVPCGDMSNFKPGDLLFYGKSRSSITHVAIYVGGGKRAHAPRTGDVVKYDSSVMHNLVLVRRVL